jgi:stage IV sporulation protein FB
LEPNWLKKLMVVSAAAHARGQHEASWVLEVRMGWSIKLFTLGGTTVRIHPTFFLLLAWVGAIYWLQAGPAEAIRGVVFVSILFVCVVLHEYGHVLAARRYGIRTPDITLLPIGGVASLERIPDKPQQEIVIALAGPVVNLAIALVLFLIWPGVVSPLQMTELETPMIARVATANILLAVFNLIPAFPMDGGRVLRALLAFVLGYTRATRVAAIIGMGVAVVFMFVGLFGSPLLLLIGLFMLIAAGWEAGYVQAREYTRGYLASHAMVTRFQALSPSATMDDAAALLLRTSQQEFPVIDGAGVFRGVLARDDIVSALSSGGGRTPVSDVMARDVPTVPPNACLDQVFELLRGKPTGFVAVLDARRHLLGYITTDSLAKFVTVASIWQKDATPQGAPAGVLQQAKGHL